MSLFFQIIFLPSTSLFVGILAVADISNDNITAACQHGDHVYPLGAQWELPGYCRWFVCEENNLISEKGCEEFNLQEDEGCYLSEYDHALSYPECCPRLNCPDPETAILQDWVNH